MKTRYPLIICWLLIGFLLSVGCVPPAPPEPPQPPQARFDVGSKPVAIEPNEACQQRQPPEKVEIENRWIKNQIIISGDAEQVQGVVRQLAQRQIKLAARTECRLGKLPSPAEVERVGGVLYSLYKELLRAAPDPDNVGELVQNLYQIENSSVEEVAKGIQEFQRERKAFVFADPNYVLGPSDNSLCSDPNSVGSSPFELGISPNSVGSSPNSVGSSPNSGPGIITDTVQADQFMTQWALEKLQLKAGQSEGQGAEVPVLIFDTSPYIGELAETQWQTRTISRPQIDPFVLTVWHPQLVNVIPTTVFTPTPHAADHGLFVAGLVHAVSPNSPIHLIRALNETGCGDLATLTSELWTYYLTNRYGSRVVINLSLGADGSTNIQDQIFALNNAILFAGFKGAVFVAAAGNSGAALGQLPARQNYVIGVAASTLEDTHACFSNGGDIAAPGGNGLVDENGCTPLSNLHCTDAACTDLQISNNLISLITQTDPGETGFAYWAGTSFATPLVSGMAARLLSDGITPAQTVINLTSAAPQGCAYPPSPPDPVLGQGLVHLDGVCN